MWPGIGTSDKLLLPGCSSQVDVSFHGGLANHPPILTEPPMIPYLSYQSGGADESSVSLAALKDLILR